MIPKKKLKVALLFICLNEPYWPYVKDVIEDCNKFFLTDHRAKVDLDYFLWSDIPDADFGATVFPTEPVPWPQPTLMRYHLFLQQEEILKDYDYLFYLDADMRVVSHVGTEILGDGLTAAQHPMYAFKPGLYFPLEPNPESAAYIKVPTHYYAGGFQGGKTKDFIAAMKAMRKTVDKDFAINYVARWNDESHWNKYLSTHPPVITLSPSYIYPDSLIKEYYEPIWGCSYKPIIVTLTKPFTVSKEGGEAVRQWLGQPMQPAKTGMVRIACEKCGDVLEYVGMQKIVECNGSGKPHGVEIIPQ